MLKRASSCAADLLKPMIPALLVVMYYDFKLRREGGDLAARTNSLQTA